MLNERFHSSEDKSFQDPIKVKQQRNKSCLRQRYLSFNNRNIFAILSLVGYTSVEIDTFIISASELLITSTPIV